MDNFNINDKLENGLIQMVKSTNLVTSKMNWNLTDTLTNSTPDYVANLYI